MFFLNVYLIEHIFIANQLKSNTKMKIYVVE